MPERYQLKRVNSDYTFHPNDQLIPEGISKGEFIKKTVLIFLIFLSISYILYSRTLDDYFLSGDFTHLETHSWSYIFKLFYNLRITKELLTREYRPLTELSHAIQLSLFGDWPPGHHAVSVSLHGISAFMLYILAIHLGLTIPVSFFAGILFLCHPAVTNIVAWICVQGDQFCAIFYLLSLIFLIKCLDHYSKNVAWQKWHLISLLSMILSCLFKEMGLTIPFAVTLIMYFIHYFRKTMFFSIGTLIRFSFPYYLIFGFYWICRILIFGGFGGYGGAKRHFQIGKFLIVNIVQYILWLLGFMTTNFAIYLGQNWWFLVIAIGLSLLVFLPNNYRFYYIWILATYMPVYNILKVTNNYIPTMIFCLMLSVILNKLPILSKIISRLLKSKSQNYQKITAIGCKKYHFTVNILVSALFLCSILSFYIVQVQLKLNDFSKASKATLMTKNETLRLFPTPPNYSTFYYMGLPDMLYGVHVLGIGIWGAMDLWYPNRDVRAFRVATSSDLLRHKPLPENFVYFLDYKGNHLLRRPRIENWYKEEFLSSGQGPGDFSAKTKYKRLFSWSVGQMKGTLPPGCSLNPHTGNPKDWFIGFSFSEDYIKPQHPKSILGIRVDAMIQSELYDTANLKIWWITEKDPIWDQGKAVHSKIKQDSQRHWLEFDLTNNLKWHFSGRITALRFRLSDNNGSPKMLKVDLMMKKWQLKEY